MKYHLFYFSCFFVFHSAMQAQNSKEPLPAGTRFIRMNITGLIDPMETNISGGIEYRFNDSWSVSCDAGWIFHSTYFENIKSTSGIIFRPSARGYFQKSRRTFAELQFHYKNVTYKIEDWLGRGCINGIPAYEEFTTFRYRKKVAGLNLNFGYQGRISRNNKLWFDVYLGVGARKKWDKVVKEEGSCYENNGPFTFTNSNFWGDDLYPSLPMGFRLLYKF